MLRRGSRSQVFLSLPLALFVCMQIFSLFPSFFLSLPAVSHSFCPLSLIPTLLIYFSLISLLLFQFSKVMQTDPIPKSLDSSLPPSAKIECDIYFFPLSRVACVENEYFYVDESIYLIQRPACTECFVISLLLLYLEIS